jgi:hypothetical protein
MPETSTSSPTRDGIEVTYAPVRRPLRKRIGWAFRSWARSTFSRESFISSFKSLLWVVPLTALIWIYAEREEDVTLNGVPVVLDVSSSEPRMFVRLAGGNPTIHVDLKGRQVDVEQVKDWLQSTPAPIEVARNLTPGEHQIYLQFELNQLARVKNKGVTISNCTPAEVTVAVDQIETMDLEVRARPEDSKTLGSPIFSPARVKISAPRHLLRQAQQDTAGQGLVAYANFAPFKQILVEPGKHSLSGVQVVPSIAIENSDIQPKGVSAELVVNNNAERTITLPYLRVLAATPRDAGARADQYKPYFDLTLTNVAVTGPEQQIALLQDPNYAPTPAPAAIFEVNYNDIENPAPAPLMFQLPPGVHVSEQDAQRKITYSFKPRSAEPQ